MTLTPNNQRYLDFLKDITTVSAACGTTTYIWGGVTIDIIQGRFLREHHDLDGFTLNLLDVRRSMSDLYEQRGYTVTFRDDFDILVIKKDGLHAAFNRLEIDGEVAMWRHIGNEGTVYFPVSWLDAVPRPFYDIRVYSAGLQLDYALKTHIHLIHATWEPRDKDRIAIAHLEAALAAANLNPDIFLRQIWSYNPYWAKRGYPQYAMPVVAKPLLPPAPPTEEQARLIPTNSEEQ